MKKGKLYWYRWMEGKPPKSVKHQTVVLCTEDSIPGTKRFAGVVVEQTDGFSDHCVGTFSQSWNAVVFEACPQAVTLDNAKWKEFVAKGVCVG